MKILLLILLTLTNTSNIVLAEDSELLKSVKRNPQEAKSLCTQFRKLNKKGLSVYGRENTSKVADSRQFSITEADVLVTYIVGMHCPDVR